MKTAKGKYAICAIIKDEQRYIKEWADYHLSIGFDDIYLYEDFDSTSHADIFKDYNNVHIYRLKENKFGLKDYQTPQTQVKLYEYFLNKCKKENSYEWVAFIDIDEYIVFEDGWNLKKLTDAFKDTPGIILCWENHGANGHIKRPKGGVMENYPKGTRKDNPDGDHRWAVKSFVHIPLCEGMLTHHTFKGCLRTNFSNNDNDTLVYDKAHINHYFTKSWEDYLDRIFKRGNMQNNYRTLDQFFYCNPDMQHLQKELIESVRYRHAADTMWLSKKLGIISGGNEIIIRELENKYL